MTENIKAAPAADIAADPMEDLDRPLTTGEILWQERFELRDPEKARRCKHVGLSEEAFREPKGASDADMTALCLSGGGIRSAAFSLGVVQALASRKLLTSFDYLSTVSGGGYLGSFLQRWMLGKPEDGRDEQHVEDLLAASLKDKTLPEIAQLREGANFITPKIGLMSSDTWAAIATSLRNVSVNWTLFVPMILIVAAVPAAFYWFLMWAGTWPSMVGAIPLVVHLLSASWAMTTVMLGLPSNRVEDVPYLTKPEITRNIMWPAALAMGTMLVILAAPPPVFSWRIWITEVASQLLGGVSPAKAQIFFVSMGFVLVPLTGFVAARILRREKARIKGRLWSDLPVWLVSGFAGGLVLYLAVTTAIDVNMLVWRPADQTGLAGAAHALSAWTGSLEGSHLIVTFGPAVYVGCLLVVGWTFSILRTALQPPASRATNQDSKDSKDADEAKDAGRNAAVLPDLDREWLVRISGDLIRVVLAWTLIALVCLLLNYFKFGSYTVNVAGTQVQVDSWDAALKLLAGAVVTGLAGAFAGKSSGAVTGFITKFLSLEIIAGLATLVFAVVGLFVAAHAVSDVTLAANAYCERSRGCFGNAYWWMFVAHIATIGVLILFVWIWGYQVDANRFSLHGFYRNRLSRAFLGAARAGEDCDKARSNPGKREPDPFTGIDPADNVRLHTLWPALKRESSEPCLFPVINVALNAVATRKLSWQQRKALPFVMTPLACGSGWLGKGDICGAEGAYIASTHYGGSERDEKLDGAGVTLAAAMAISGAAASPSMGYHSSPATAFLMTLFNVRLGAWMPNPGMWQAGKHKVSRFGIENPAAGRRNGAMPLLRELTGNTREDSRDVYLSDGGHFENLGLYEMLRRRCTRIFVVDAGCDEHCAFEDLSNAARKAAIDLNVKLKFGHIRLTSRELPQPGSIAYAMADIVYPEGWSGRLIYLKPSLIDDLPIDVRAYAVSSKSFPHETTADQWYTEAQFESYRNLGATLFETLCVTRGDRTYDTDKRNRPLGRRARMTTFFDDVEDAIKAVDARCKKGGAEK